MYTSTSLFIENFNLACARSVEVLIFIGGALCFFNAFKKETNSHWFTTLLLCTIFYSPVFINNCGVGSADAVMTIFYGASIYYQYRYFKEKSRSTLIIAALFTIFCALTKNEGLAAAFLSITLFPIFSLIQSRDKKSITNVILFASIIIFMLMPWLIWSREIPSSDENYPAHIYAIFTSSSLLITIKVFIKFLKTLFELKFLPVMLTLIFALAIARKKFFISQTFIIRLAYLCGHISIYILIFSITPWDLSFLYKTALNRVLLHLIPAFLFLASAAYASSQQETVDSA
jgi:hypothetical protein